MKKVFLVEACYSDYEWSRIDTIGIFLTKEEAEAAKTKYLSVVEKLRDTPNPLTDEERDIDVVDLPDDRYKKYEKYQNKINSVDHFDQVVVTPITVGKVNLKIN